MFLIFWWDNKIAIETIKKGLSNSIGWNLGKNAKSIHLFDPFTSEPIKGTSVKNIKLIKNKTIEILNNFFFSIKDRDINTEMLKIINIKCLIKK